MKTERKILLTMTVLGVAILVSFFDFVLGSLIGVPALAYLFYLEKEEM